MVLLNRIMLLAGISLPRAREQVHSNEKVTGSSTCRQQRADEYTTMKSLSWTLNTKSQRLVIDSQTDTAYCFELVRGLGSL